MPGLVLGSIHNTGDKEEAAAWLLTIPIQVSCASLKVVRVGLLVCVCVRVCTCLCVRLCAEPG